MTERRVLRWGVPVDGEWHRIVIDNDADVAHVDCRRPDLVEFWTVEPVRVSEVHDGTAGRFVTARYDAEPGRAHAYEFQVFGTGQPVEDGIYVGTALAAGGALVWHLFRRQVQIEAAS